MYQKSPWLLVGVGMILLGLPVSEARAQFGGLSATERALLLGLGMNRVNNQDFLRTMWALESMERSRMFQQQQFVRQRMAAQRATAEQARLRGIMQRSPNVVPAPQGETSPSVSEGPSSDVLVCWEVFGATFMEANPNDVSVIDARFDGGMRVAAIQVRGAADRAKWESGDIIVGMHRYRIRNYDNLAYVAELPDLVDLNPLKVKFLRGGKLYEGTIDVFAGSANGAPSRSTSDEENDQAETTSARSSNLAKELRPTVKKEASDLTEDERIWQQIGIRGGSISLSREGLQFDRGVVLRSIRPGSPADAAGWKIGESLVGLGDYQIKELTDLIFVLDQPNDKPMTWVLVNGGGLRKGDILLSPEKRAATEADPRASEVETPVPVEGTPTPGPTPTEAESPTLPTPEPAGEPIP